MYTRAQVDHEQSLGKDHDETKSYAKNMIALNIQPAMNDKDKRRALIAMYPFVAQGDDYSHT